MSFIRSYSLYLAWVVSLIAVGGSLFFREVLGFVPCKLCWFLSIFMYPLVILLGKATYRNDRRIAGYVLPLSIIGGLISLYHYGEQMIPWLGSLLPCTAGVPCNQAYLQWFGFITIPFMALIAFTLITVILWIGSGKGKETSKI